MRTTFTKRELKILRTLLAKHDSVSPEALEELHKILARCSNAALRQLAKANIKFLSSLAANACIHRGLLSKTDTGHRH
jgi:hypothetical protein